MKRRNKPILFIDMDGVITDFDIQFEKFSKINAREYEAKYGEDAFWDKVNSHGIKFWSTMPWTSGGKRLLNFVRKYDPFILSAIPKKKHSRIVTKGKLLWLANNLTGRLKIIICKRKEKMQYCQDNAILVDDYHKTISEWQKIGGIAILHINTSRTIRELVKYFKIRGINYNERKRT
ncbi:hypothetical protein ACFLQL_03055 [Verrucomicrobiota bacterium]